MSATLSGPGFAGYASTETVDLDGDIIERDAFDPDQLADWLQRGHIVWAHRPDLPVGVPMSAKVDDVGLWITAAFLDTPRGREAREVLLQRQRLGRVPYGLSIGFVPLERRPIPRGRGYRITRLRLLEVSLVAIAANPQAEVVLVRGWRDGRPARPEVERELRRLEEAEIEMARLKAREKAWGVKRPAPAADVERELRRLRELDERCRRSEGPSLALIEATNRLELAQLRAAGVGR